MKMKKMIDKENDGENKSNEKWRWRSIENSSAKTSGDERQIGGVRVAFANTRAAATAFARSCLHLRAHQQRGCAWRRCAPISNGWRCHAMRTRRSLSWRKRHRAASTSRHLPHYAPPSCARLYSASRSRAGRHQHFITAAALAHARKRQNKIGVIISAK
jgi:hypothetical protein